MRRSIALTLMLLAGSGALATIPTVRQAALAQLRSITAPLFGQDSDRQAAIRTVVHRVFLYVSVIT